MLRFLWVTFLLAVLGLLAAGGGGIWLLWKYGQDLPDYRQLANYEPAVSTRVHAADGTLIAEFARERRLFVPIDAIPRPVIQAFLSAEDKTFYQHPGIDFVGVAAAVIKNVQNMGKNRRPVGASTITQQVAKNFLLTNEVSITRKLKEAILAFRIEQAFTKDQILELYLNEIYLGYQSYGVAAAALNYFDKSLDELTLAEAAYLAALPKAPNNYHPIRRKEQALIRRDWVIERMQKDGVVSAEQAAAAKNRDLVVKPGKETGIFRADYFVEGVRREILELYGEDRLYGGGLSVRTTLDSRLQAAAQQALRKGLIAYDRRHGWRGPISTVALKGAPWLEQLRKVPRPAGMDDWIMAVVLEVGDKDTRVGLETGTSGILPFEGLKWARAWIKEQRRGPPIKSAREVLNVGDVIAVSALSASEDDSGKVSETALPTSANPLYRLEQLPGINGAIVAIDPHTGRIKAMVGGFSHDISVFNRVIQAQRQPGSAFKPFVYAAALDNGFTPSSLVLDAPFVVDQGPLQGKWKPANYTKKFFGPSTLRLGIEKSRNLMTVRLAQYIGMDVVIDYARRFGVVDDMPPYLPMALGAGETNLMRLTLGYAMFVNGGKQVRSSLIDRVQDRRGKTIFKHDRRPCDGCEVASWNLQKEPVIPDIREEVIDPRTAYQIVSMLQGVVERGTGRRIREVKKPLAGKTGTTNNSNDAWFLGFSPDLAVGVYAGFDEPRSLGRDLRGIEEQGATVAVPIFRDFFAEALKDEKAIPFRVPPGIQLVRVDARTGKLARPGDKGVIWEAFKEGQLPKADAQVLGGGEEDGNNSGQQRLRTGSGGLY